MPHDVHPAAPSLLSIYSIDLAAAVFMHSISILAAQGSLFMCGDCYSSSGTLFVYFCW